HGGNEADRCTIDARNRQTHCNKYAAYIGSGKAAKDSGENECGGTVRKYHEVECIDLDAIMLPGRYQDPRRDVLGFVGDVLTPDPGRQLIKAVIVDAGDRQSNCHGFQKFKKAARLTVQNAVIPFHHMSSHPSADQSRRKAAATESASRPDRASSVSRS